MEVSENSLSTMSYSAGASYQISTTSQYLIFMLSNNLYGFLLSHIREVSPWNEVTPFPVQRKSFLGCVNIRREVVPVYNPEALGICKVADSESSSFQYILIADVNQETFGLPVQKIHKIVDVDSAILRPLDEFAGNENLGIFTHAVSLNEQNILIVDPQFCRTSRFRL